MSKFLTLARQLQEFPILHRFVTHFITEHMSEATSAYPDIFKEVAKYEVAGYCTCMECGTFYLKTWNDPKTLDTFETVQMVDNDLIKEQERKVFHGKSNKV